MNQLNFPFFKTWSNQQVDHFSEIKEVTGPTTFEINENNQVINDLSSISFQAAFGLRNKDIESAIVQQISSHSVATPSFYSQKQLNVAKKLIDLLELDGKIFFTVSGAEAIENALKIVRQVTSRKIILSRKKSYHGATLGALDMTGDWRRSGHALPKDMHEWIPEPTDDPDFSESTKIIERIGPEKIAGICLETISGKNGVIIPPMTWWVGLKNIQSKYNIKIILDEIICGFYRTQKAFGFHHFNFLPDIVCLGKAITGGMIPFGATFCSKEISNFFSKNVLSAGLTNYAHPLGLAALEAVLSLANSPAFLRNLNKNCQLTEQFAINIAKKSCANEVRSIGMLLAIDLKNALSYNYFLNKGLHLVVNGQTIILAPVLNADHKLLNESLNKLEQSIGD